MAGAGRPGGAEPTSLPLLRHLALAARPRVLLVAGSALQFEPLGEGGDDEAAGVSGVLAIEPEVPLRVVEGLPLILVAASGLGVAPAPSLAELTIIEDTDFALWSGLHAQTFDQAVGGGTSGRSPGPPAQGARTVARWEPDVDRLARDIAENDGVLRHLVRLEGRLSKRSRHLFTLRSMKRAVQRLTSPDSRVWVALDSDLEPRARGEAAEKLVEEFWNKVGNAMMTNWHEVAVYNAESGGSAGEPAHVIRDFSVAAHATALLGIARFGARILDRPDWPKHVGLLDMRVDWARENQDWERVGVLVEPREGTVFDHDDSRCVVCRAGLEDGHRVARVEPVELLSSSTPGGLVTLCVACEGQLQESPGWSQFVADQATALGQHDLPDRVAARLRKPPPLRISKASSAEEAVADYIAQKLGLDLPA